MDNTANYLYIQAMPSTSDKAPFIRGMTWTPPAAIRPAVISAVERGAFLSSNSRRMSYPSWVLDYSLTAGFKTRVGSHRGPWLERGSKTAHLYPPRTPYWEDVENNAPFQESCWIMFHGGEDVGLASLVGARPKFATFRDPGFLLGRELGRLFHNDLQGKDVYWQVQAQFYSIARLLLAALRTGEGEYEIMTADQETANESAGLTDRVRAWLGPRLGEKVSLPALARDIGISVSTLTHRYRKEAGETPMETLLGMRMQVVKSLLLKGCGLKEIASQAGFCDEYHLSRVFKKRDGLSPREFVRASVLHMKA